MRRRLALLAWSSLLLAGCSENDDKLTITGPELTAPTDQARVYPIKDVTFTTADSVEVNALYGQRLGAGPSPVVILVHDVFNFQQGRLEWLLSGFFEQLLDAGYLPLAIELRGHGLTAFPNDHPTGVLERADTEKFHLEVRAALNWLKDEPSADVGRVAIVGNGAGGNVAYVSMGAFPTELRAGVALSPGLWGGANFDPLTIGADLEDFAPHTMLFLVGENDFLPVDETQALSYAVFAQNLAALTDDPKILTVYEGQTAHGLALLQSQEEATNSLLSWLESHL